MIKPVILILALVRGNWLIPLLLAACAMMWASTGEQKFKERTDYVIDELKRCQDVKGTGYIGSVEDSIWMQVGEGEIYSTGFDLMWDEGIVSQTIMLSAVEKGYGGCMIGSCKRVEILEAVELDPQRYSLALVLALGKPKEEVRMVPVGEDDSTTYYRDENQVHYVPKRALEDILV